MESFKIFIETICILATIFLIIKEMIRSSQLLQQEQYHIKGYLKCLKRIYFYNVYNLIIIPTFILFYFLNNIWIQMIYLIILSTYYYFNRQQTIKELKFTKRIIRLWVIHLAIITTIYTFIMWEIQFTTLIQVLLICLVLTPVNLLLSHIVIWPLEYLIQLYYVKKASQKIKMIDAKKIAITGSFGKTSTKSILYHLLKDKFITKMSPKSYNTLMGISLMINNDATYSDEVLILEMGATHTGDIQKLVNLTNPHYAIITDIGPQHLETFKTIENIINEKLAVISSPNNQLVVLNKDNQYLSSQLPLLKGKNVVTFGLEPSCDFYASNILYSKDGLTFDIFYPQGKLTIKTKLLGKHNIYNILACIALIKSVDDFNKKITDEEIIFNLENIEPIPHRLSLISEKDFIIIDDSYNSNPNGFRNALEVLTLFKGPRILITPGIVDAGKMQEEINYHLANEIHKSCDFVYLVNNQSTKAIAKGLDELGHYNYEIVRSYKEAREKISLKYQQGTILIENDLTDNYFVRG